MLFAAVARSRWQQARPRRKDCRSREGELLEFESSQRFGVAGLVVNSHGMAGERGSRPANNLHTEATVSAGRRGQGGAEAREMDGEIVSGGCRGLFSDIQSRGCQKHEQEWPASASTWAVKRREACRHAQGAGRFQWGAPPIGRGILAPSGAARSWQSLAPAPLQAFA